MPGRRQCVTMCWSWEGPYLRWRKNGLKESGVEESYGGREGSKPVQHPAANYWFDCYPIVLLPCIFSAVNSEKKIIQEIDIFAHGEGMQGFIPLKNTKTNFLSRRWVAPVSVE